MGRHKQFDDTAVVRAARDVFWQRGYASTSLADLEAATGLSRSSMYQTYGSKRGLFDRALRNYLEELIWPMLAPMEATGAAREEIVGYFLAQATNLRRARRSVLTHGCLIANTSTPLPFIFCCICTREGISSMQGGHQVAQKFSTTTLPRNSSRLTLRSLS